MKFRIFIAFLLVLGSFTVEAQRRGGGARAGAGGGARAGAGGGTAVHAGGATYVNRDVARTSVRSNQDVTRNVNRNGDINRNINREVDRDIGVHRDIDIDAHYDRWGHPVAWGAAAGVAAGVTAAATSAALGTSVAMLPSGCTTTIVGGVAYSQCGSSWYQPYYMGTTVQYTVVNAPQ